MKIVFTLAIITFAMANISYASGDGGDDGGDERISHYEVEAPKTTKEALVLLEKKITEVEEAAKSTDLHTIHEQSYHLEAAVETLEDRVKKLKAALEDLEEVIEVVHEASEDDEILTVNKNIPILRKNFNKVKSFFVN